MASDPNQLADPEPDIEVESDDETVVDQGVDPYEEAVEKPLKDSENFIPSEEL